MELSIRRLCFTSWFAGKKNKNKKRKMSTVENLFVQIFERKNQIIDQVKRQKDAFDHHLASKLIIEGFNPPPWLLTPSFDISSLDPKGTFLISLASSRNCYKFFRGCVRLPRKMKGKKIHLVIYFYFYG